MTKSNCMRCESTRILTVSAECYGSGYYILDGLEVDGYVPPELNIGYGDYLKFDVCANCGQMVGTWPIPRNILAYDEKKEA